MIARDKSNIKRPLTLQKKENTGLEHNVFGMVAILQTLSYQGVIIIIYVQVE